MLKSCRLCGQMNKLRLFFVLDIMAAFGCQENWMNSEKGRRMAFPEFITAVFFILSTPLHGRG